MTTNKETLQDHEGRLQEIEIQLGIKRPLPKKNRWKRSTDWMRANPWLSWPLAITLALLTLFGGYWLNHRQEWWNHDVDERVQTVLNEKDGINETLHRMERTVNRIETKLETLEPFIHDVIQHQFDSVAKLPTAALQQRLPAVQHLLAVAENQDVKVNPNIAAALSRNLLHVQTDTPAYWPVVGAIINYRSSLLPNSPQISVKFPACRIVPDLAASPNSKTQIINPKTGKIETEFTPSNVATNDCYIELDGRTIAHWTCGHCVVKYSGGPVALTDVTFANCLFLFDVQPPQIPPPSGAHLSQILLASALTDIKIKSL